jgi:hypothetical protein
LAWLGGLALAALVLALAAAAAVWAWPGLAAPWLLDQLAPEGGEARAQSLELGLSPPRLAARGLVRQGPGAGVVRVAELEVVLDPAAWWAGEPWLARLTASGLEAELPAPEPGAPAGPPDLEALGVILHARRVRVAAPRLELPLAGGRLVLSRVELEVEPAGQKRRDFRLAAGADWRGPLGRAHARLTGSGRVSAGPRLSAELELAGGRLPGLEGPARGGAYLELTPRRLELSSLELSAGPLELAGRAATDLEGSRASLELDHLTWRGLGYLERAGWQGSWGQGLSGELTAAGGLAAGGLVLQGAEISLPLAGSLGRPRVRGGRLVVPAGGLAWRERSLPAGQLRLSGDAAWDGAGLALSGLELRAAALGRLSGELGLGPGLGLRARGEGLEAPALLAVAEALAGRELTAWRLKGAVDLEAKLSPGRPRMLAATLASSDLGAESPGGEVMLGGLAGRLQGRAGLAWGGPLAAELRLDQGQALAGTVFLDLASAPLSLRLSGRSLAGPGLAAEELELELAGFGRLAGRGRVRREQGAWRHQGELVLEQADLGRIFATFVREPLAAAQPRLASWRVQGAGRAELAGSGRGLAAEVRGRVRLSGGSLSDGDGRLVEGAKLELPVAYRLGRPGPREPARPEEWGRLRAEAVRAGGLALVGLELGVALTPNRLWTRGSLSLPLWGGRVRVSGLEVDRPLSPGFAARGAVSVLELDLSRLGGPVPLEGLLSGRLAPVSLSARRLRAGGELKGRLFGGALTVKGLAAEYPLRPGRELAADISASMMQLKPLSRALGVGLVTGRLDAAAENLRVAYGQPVAFDLAVRSVEAEGVDQRVSLKAVNTISVIGTGSGLSGMGVGLFSSFFSEFPYQKIAFRCRLRNDVFRLRGLIREDGVEYLVKRPPLMGINVINRNPDNRISFSDMLKRLKRVTQPKDKEGS